MPNVIYLHSLGEGKLSPPKLWRNRVGKKSNRTVLFIGGLDSSGGAGLDRDRRTAEGLGCTVRGAATAVTVQGQYGVEAIEKVSPEILRLQIETHLREDKPRAIKIGALFGEDQISLIKTILKEWKKVHPHSIIVADPVFAPTHGPAFLQKEEIESYRSLLSLLDVITPNKRELELLGDHKTESPREGEMVAWKLACEFNISCILTGGHFPGRRLREKVVTPEKTFTYTKRRRALSHTHGTGCCLSSALTAYLAKGDSLKRAFSRATKLVTRQMK
ncbi:MAG: hydroxymethylpyrimidine/phosphomethylpyrimidine kinase [Spirochaetales bacterium]|nr:hydroxymethylpyrimidine/phosphomethylpyrimidine kinase [Spirochaetales bacterium]